MHKLLIAYFFLFSLFAQAVPSDSEVRLYALQAEQGDPEAQYNLGRSYLNGYAPHQVDNSKGIFWLQESASQKYPQAIYALGQLHLYGSFGMEKNTDTAAIFYKEAADLGFDLAQYDIATLHYTRSVSNPKDDIAFEYFKKAAEQNFTLAQYNLGVLYYEGKAVKKNNNQAAYWYNKAAKKEHPEALFNLSQMYYAGEGVMKDAGKSFDYCKRAAELGHVDAQTNLGVNYASGYGCSTDYIQAYRWSKIAAKEGSGMAKQTLRKLEGMMTRSDKLKAEALIKKQTTDFERIEPSKDIKTPAVTANERKAICEILEEEMASQHLKLGLTSEQLKAKVTCNEANKMLVYSVTGTLSQLTSAQVSLDSMLANMPNNGVKDLKNYGFSGLTVKQNGNSASHDF